MVCGESHLSKATQALKHPNIQPHPPPPTQYQSTIFGDHPWYSTTPLPHPPIPPPAHPPTRPPRPPRPPAHPKPQEGAPSPRPGAMLPRPPSPSRRCWWAPRTCGARCPLGSSPRRWNGRTPWGGKRRCFSLGGRGGGWWGGGGGGYVLFFLRQGKGGALLSKGYRAKRASRASSDFTMAPASWVWRRGGGMVGWEWLT